MADADDIAARVVIYAPEFTGDTRIATLVEDAIAAHTKTSWTNVYVQAMAYYVAHVLTMLGAVANTGVPPAGGGAGASSGAVTSEQAGDVSRSYGTAAANASASGGLTATEAELFQTPYGRSYIRLRDSRAAARGRIVSVGL